MNKFKVIGDPNNIPFCSSEIIISALNKAARTLGIYSDDNLICGYDGLANHHGYRVNGIICLYELALPKIIKHNANGVKLIGGSKQNQLFYIQGGYPKELTDFCLLGVDTKLWHPKPERKKNKFRFFSLFDSNTRACYDEILIAFSKAFKNNNDIELYIKDRWATNLFKTYITEYAKFLGVNLIYNDQHTTDREVEKELYAEADCHLFINRSSTFALTVVQGMAMQKPTITMAYSGPQDYCNELNARIVKHTLEPVTIEKLSALESKGYRNYLIPPSPQNYDFEPLWAEPDIDDLSAALLDVYTNRDYREQIAFRARATMECISWERAALNLSFILEENQT